MKPRILKLALPYEWWHYQHEVDQQVYELQEHERWLRVIELVQRVLALPSWSRNLDWTALDHALYHSHWGDRYHCRAGLRELDPSSACPFTAFATVFKVVAGSASFPIPRPLAGRVD